MANHISLDKITTKAATEEFKDGWERIFGGNKQEKIYCRTCGIDRTDGAMCEGCSDAVARSLNRKRQIMQAGEDL